MKDVTGLFGITRRNFVKTGAAAFGATLAPSVFGGDRPRLKLGIVSDIHISRTGGDKSFEKALRRFDAEKADAVVFTGDFSSFGTWDEMKLSADSWFRVFPNDRRSDGEKIERIFITGNHEIEAVPKVITDEVRRDYFAFNREKFWRELFHEEYRSLSVKRVKGYVFVLRNWLLKGETVPFAETMAGLAPTLPKDRPFFYLQHPAIRKTVNSAEEIGGLAMPNYDGFDDGSYGAVLEKFPNCMALTGHTHYTLTDERSIWQGAYTAVNCSCLRGYAFSYPGRENGHAGDESRFVPEPEMEMFNVYGVHQAMSMEVFDDRIVLHRYDSDLDRSLGPDWVVPLFAGGSTVPASGTPKFDFKSRKLAAVAPQFPADAKVSVTTRMGRGFNRKGTPHQQVVVAFPPIPGKGGEGRAMDFSVTCEASVADARWTVAEKRVFSPNFCHCEEMDVAPCTCVFDARTIPVRFGLRFIVTPFDTWGNAGRPIVSQISRLKLPK